MNDGQYQMGSRLFGAGTAYRVVDVELLEDDEARDGDRPLPREDGDIPGLHLRASRTPMFKVRVRADDSDELEILLADWYAAFQIRRDTQDVLSFKLPGQPERMVRCRTVRRSRPRTVETELTGVVELQVALKLADPRIYSVEEFSALVDIFEASGGGFNLPVVELPLNMTASTQALATAHNAGSRDAYPVIRFQYPSGGSGTCTGVQLENLTNGDLLDIDTTLVAGQTLTADMDALIRATGDSVVHIGGSSRYADWVPPRDPFRLSPGDNSLKFEVTGTSLDIVCSVQWRSTD